ncbi:MAG: hypothetical protein WCB27_15240 [Thermoguttaceae bacterium]
MLIVLLAVEGFLLLSERFGWFAFDEYEGLSAMIAIASVVAVMVLTFLWWVLALCFHWRFQFSLRSLLVFTVAVAIPFSWLAVEMKRAREQREAVAAIEKAGGTVFSEPTWLGKFLRDDSLVRVTGVGFFREQTTDAALVHLEGLSQLPNLWLCNTQVTDAGLEHLEGLSQLQFLWLSNTKITAAGLVHLEGLSQLENLGLDSTQVTNAGLVHLQRLSQLKALWLGRTKVTDAGLLHLQGLSQLQVLQLYNTQVTRQGVKKLQQALPNCEIQR